MSKEHYDRDIFFREARNDPFPGKFIQQQVDGLELLLKIWEPLPYTDRRWLAYILATVYAETAIMLPIEEFGKGKGHKYGIPDPETGKTYYGRGWVQITWKANYQKATDKINSRNLLGRKVDLVNNPEQALEGDVAGVILYYGMVEGWFTGHKLSDYFAGAKEDWVNARRIVNAMDRANEIANNARAFYEALSAAATTSEPQQPVEPTTRGPDPVLAGLIARIKDRSGAKEVRIII